MDDLFKIITLLGTRIDDLAATSSNQIAVGDPARQALYKAQYRALQAVVHDLKSVMVPDAGPPPKIDRRTAFIVEMGGQRTAMVVDDADRDAVVDRFETEHRVLIDDVGHCKWKTWPVTIPPLDQRTRRRRSGILDMRLALITEVDGDMFLTIYNTEAELQEATAEFESDHDHMIASQEASCCPIDILIPPRGSGFGTGPSGPC